MIIINNNITTDTTFFRGNTYVIKGKVRVQANVTLTIENNALIYIMNGPMGSCLIFDTGSTMKASTFCVKACDAFGQPENYSYNRGLWFLGSSSIAEKDLIAMTFSVYSSSFNAKRINTFYLGMADPADPDNPKNPDDVDAVSILGVGDNEWNVREIAISYSGDDGIDVENSSITLDYLCVYNPREDGVNVTSSRLNILKTLVVNMVTADPAHDRDIFDLETDDGPSYVRIAKNCKVKISGIFGDQLTLVSNDLPQPHSHTRYDFQGVCTNGQSYVYAGFVPKLSYQNIKNTTTRTASNITKIVKSLL